MSTTETTVEENESTDNLYGMNLLLLKRIKKLFKIIVPSFLSLPMMVVILLFLITGIQEISTYFVGLIPSKFYKAILAEDKVQFKKEIIVGTCFIFMKAVTYSTQNYISSVLQITWRQVLTQYLHRRYLTGTNCFQLNLRSPKIKNADQRITQDVNSMCLQLSQLINYLMITPLIVIYYSYQTFTVVGYEGLVAAYGFFFITGCINLAFMSPIVKSTARQERCEGDFRFQHMHLRIHSESIAFQKSEKIEFSQVNKKLNILSLAMQSLANRMFPLFFFTELAAYAENVVSYLVVAGPIFAGKFGDKSDSDLSSLISQNAFVLGYLLNCFVGILKITANISSIAGSTHRIAEMVEEIDKREKEERESRSASCLQTNKKEDPDLAGDQILLEFHGITARTPTKTGNVKIIDNLKLKLLLNKNLLITGNGSCGKTSLLRVIRGLWRVESGKIVHTSLLQEGPSSVLYLPKVPLMTAGTLRQQIIYPLIIDTMGDEYTQDDNSSILGYLEDLGLQNLVNLCGDLDREVNWNWYTKVTISDAQKLSLVRLFYHRPKIAILDDVMSHLDHATIERVYNEFKRLNVTVMTVGEPNLKRYHDFVLTIFEKGKWNLE